MALRTGITRRKAITDHLAAMLVHHLKTHVFKGPDDENMAQRTGISAYTLEKPWWTDIPEICEASSLDVGLVVRDQKGNEVTFWPSESLGSGWKPPKVAQATPPPLPTVLDSHRTTPLGARSAARSWLLDPSPRHGHRPGNT